MNKDELLKNQIRAMIEKAKRSIESAKRQIEEGDFDFASSRAYYAAFYAMEAILLTKNFVFSKHSGVISAFNQHFIKTAILPKEFSKLVTRLFRERQIGDYEFDLSIDEDEAREDLEISKKVIDDITIYLIREGFFK